MTEQHFHFHIYIVCGNVIAAALWKLQISALQKAEKRGEVKGKGEKERYTHLNAEFQRIARRNKKAFLSDQCKVIEENNRIVFLGKNNGKD